MNHKSKNLPKKISKPNLSKMKILILKIEYVA